MVIDSAAVTRRNLWAGAAIFAVAGVLAVLPLAIPLLVLGIVFLAAAALFGWGAVRTRGSAVFEVTADGVRCVSDGWFVAWSDVRMARVTSQVLTSPVSERRATGFCLELAPSDVDSAAGRADIVELWVAEDGVWRRPVPSAAVHRLTRAVRSYRR